MPKFIYIMSYFFCELSIKIKVPLLSVVSDCISVPMIINKNSFAFHFFFVSLSIENQIKSPC